MEMKTMNKNKTFLALLLVALLATVSLAAVAMSAEESSAVEPDEVLVITTTDGYVSIPADTQKDIFLNYNGAEGEFEVRLNASYTGTIYFGTVYEEEVDGVKEEKCYVQDQIYVEGADKSVKVIADLDNTELIVVRDMSVYSATVTPNEVTITVQKGLVKFGMTGEESFTGTIKTAQAEFSTVDTMDTYVYLAGDITYLQGEVNADATTTVASKFVLESGEATILGDVYAIDGTPEDDTSFDVGAGVEFVVDDGATLNISDDSLVIVGGVIAGAAETGVTTVDDWYLYEMTVGGKTLERNYLAEKKITNINTAPLALRANQAALFTDDGELAIAYLAVDVDTETKAINADGITENVPTERTQFEYYVVSVSSGYDAPDKDKRVTYKWEAAVGMNTDALNGIDANAIVSGLDVSNYVKNGLDVTNNVTGFNTENLVLFSAENVIGKLFGAPSMQLITNGPADPKENIDIKMAENGDIIMTVNGCDKAWNAILFIDMNVGGIPLHYQFFVDVTPGNVNIQAMFADAGAARGITETTMDVAETLSVLGTVNVPGNGIPAETEEGEGEPEVPETKLVSADTGYIGVYGNGVIKYTSILEEDPLGRTDAVNDAGTAAKLKAAFYGTYDDETEKYTNYYTSLTTALAQKESDVTIYGKHFIADADPTGYPADGTIAELSNSKIVEMYSLSLITIDDGKKVTLSERNKFAFNFVEVKEGKLTIIGKASDEGVNIVGADTFKAKDGNGEYADLYTAIDEAISGETIELRRDATIGKTVTLIEGVTVDAKNTHGITVFDEELDDDSEYIGERIVFTVNGTVKGCMWMDLINADLILNVSDKTTAAEGADYFEILGLDEDAGDISLLHMSDASVMFNKNFFIGFIIFADEYYDNAESSSIIVSEGAAVSNYSAPTLLGLGGYIGADYNAQLVFNVLGDLNLCMPGRDVGELIYPMNDVHNINVNVGAEANFKYFGVMFVNTMTVAAGGNVLPEEICFYLDGDIEGTDSFVFDDDYKSALIITNKLIAGEFNHKLVNNNSSDITVYLYFERTEAGEWIYEKDANGNRLPASAAVYGNADKVRVYGIERSETRDFVNIAGYAAGEGIYGETTALNTMFVTQQTKSEVAFDLYATVYAGSTGLSLVNVDDPNYITLESPKFDGYDIGFWSSSKLEIKEVTINAGGFVGGTENGTLDAGTFGYKALWLVNEPFIATGSIVLPDINGIRGYEITDADGKTTIEEPGTIPLSEGTYTIRFLTEDGYDTEEVTLKIDGKEGKEISVDVAGDKIYTVEVVGEPVKESTGGDDEGLGLIEILLIIIVIAIVVMAIILIVRLSRS